MSTPKRYTLTRVGAGPGAAVFTCENLPGTEVQVIDAADYDAIEADAERYRWLKAAAPNSVCHITWLSRAACEVSIAIDPAIYVDRCVDAARADPLVDVHSDSVQSAATNSEPHR